MWALNFYVYIHICMRMCVGIIGNETWKMIIQEEKWDLKVVERRVLNIIGMKAEKWYQGMYGLSNKVREK